MEQAGGNTAGYPQSPVLLIARDRPSRLRTDLPVNGTPVIAAARERLLHRRSRGTALVTLAAVIFPRSRFHFWMSLKGSTPGQGRGLRPFYLPIRMQMPAAMARIGRRMLA